ncbi:nose resistant to fluoxetine protein 6 isoform X2 [Nilaparvata lugens]|uniref:nose resistant to fluoxetine protein 6 isoform X2 n=1 Tax=Nilaparvata lugens TaxID=108931 RepID=UPI00193DFBFF|nr:nose resistant to fluoxetine protein 6 isoform X2 [Nilaparvata lugens]
MTRTATMINCCPRKSLLLLVVLQGLFLRVKCETASRHYLEETGRNLPTRLKGMGVHGHFDMMRDDRFGLFVPDRAPSGTCRNQSQHYLDAILNYERWGLQMADSSASIPIGLFHGNLQSLGNFDECLATEKLTPFKIQYCVLFVKNLHKLPNTVPSWEETDHIAGGPPFLKPFLQIGVCLPASCNSSDLQHHYQQVTARYNLSVQLHKYSCTTNDQPKNIDSLDVFTVLLVGFIAAMCILATFADIYNLPSPKQSGLHWGFLNCFSLYRNGKNLLKPSDPEAPLAVIHGIRMLTSLCIMYGHHILILNIYPFFDYNYYVENSESPSFIFAIMSELQVDSFLLINGVLLYNGFYHLLVKQGRKFNLPKFYLHHILRIGPSYLIIMLLTMTILRFLSEGPLWKYYVFGSRDTCAESWWAHALFLNNYLMTDRQCIATTWYLALDMQLYIISPLIVLPLLKHWRYVAKFFIPILIIIGILLRAWVSYVNNYPATNMFDRLAFRNDMYEKEYTPTHLRFAPWLIGIMTGYIIINYKTKMSKAQVRTGWAVYFAILSVLISSTFYLNSRNAPNNIYLNAAYNGLSSSLWVVCLGWIIFACEMGHAGFVKKFLSWPLFHPFSRITYTMYLVGPILQFGSVAVRRSVLAMNTMEGYKNLAGEILLILLIGPMYSMFFEAPFIQINKMMMHQDDTAAIIHGSSKIPKTDPENNKTYDHIVDNAKNHLQDNNLELNTVK